MYALQETARACALLGIGPERAHPEIVPECVLLGIVLPEFDLRITGRR